MTEKLDLVRYEIFRHRLFNILEEGRVVVKMVSGSPVVVEGGETMTCFCTREGRTIAIAAGILLQAVGAKDFVRKAIELFQDNPGFTDGDQLFFNDPYIGGQHLADQVIIKPIFYKNELIAWAGSIMHTADIGGLVASGMPANATQLFQEGARFIGLKIMEKDILRNDVYQTLLAQARDPHFLALDTKAKIAANNTCGRRYLELVGKFGLDFVEQASDQLIRDSEQMAREKLAKLPDGIWQSRLYGDNTGAGADRPYQVRCAMTKRGGDLIIDLTGSSPQNEGSMNCTLPATWGQVFVPLTSQLFWDIPWNDGILAPVRVIAPEGSVVNCKFPAACSRGVMTVGCLVRTAVHQCISRMLYAGGMLEDVNSSWMGATGGAFSFEGMNQYGSRCGGIILDSFAGGVGATPFRDGVDAGGNMINPQSCISDVEIIEMNLPLMYLKRAQAADSGGFGRHSGGMAPQAVYMIQGSDDFKVALYRHSRRTPNNWGMFGGYPGAVNDSFLVLNPNIKDWFRESRTPAGVNDAFLLGGKLLNPDAPNVPMTAVKDEDLIFTLIAAGGGYGDPLERAPERVLADVKRGAITPDTAIKMYGVVIDSSGETDKPRDVMVKERLSLKKGAALPRQGTVPGKTLVRFHEYLEVAEGDRGLFIRCVKCRHTFCEASENYKRYALTRERDLSEVNLRRPFSGQPMWTVYQEYICPGCGTLLEVDSFCPQLYSEDSKILWDAQLLSFR